MGGTGLPTEGSKQKPRRKPIGPIYSGLALGGLWFINVLVVIFGWPFLLYGKIKYRKEQPERRSVN